MGFTYIIEHMEDDEDSTMPLPPWVELEYTHMRTLSGADASIKFTHLSRSSCAYLDAAFTASPEKNLAPTSTATIGVADLIAQSGVPAHRVCLLDPKAEQELSPDDGGVFDWFLFGGILGDDPPRDRTSELRALGLPSRHLGPVQMTTDTALGVTKIVVHDKTPLNKIAYIDYPTIRFNAKESVEMPFRYIADGTTPRLPPGMRELLYNDLDKGFEF